MSRCTVVLFRQELTTWKAAPGASHLLSVTRVLAKALRADLPGRGSA